jgi:hypothetical protein
VARAGSAHVIDGTTLILAGSRVRLWGIDAPEAGLAWDYRSFSDGAMPARRPRPGRPGAGVGARLRGAVGVASDGRPVSENYDLEVPAAGTPAPPMLPTAAEAQPAAPPTGLALGDLLGRALSDFGARATRALEQTLEDRSRRQALAGTIAGLFA